MLAGIARRGRNISPWENRVRRVEDLLESLPFAQEILSFYREILLFQKSLHDSLLQEIERDGLQTRAPRFDGPSIHPNLPVLVSFFSPFLSLVERIGSHDLGQAARKLASTSKDDWQKLIKLYWHDELDEQELREGQSLLFFPKAFLQPYAEILAQLDHVSGSGGEGKWRVQQGGEARCPLCGRSPQVAVLRTEGEGAGRFLVCCLCATEWRYKRVCCPACGEEDFSQLSYHKTQEFPHLRVDNCQSCRTYIKTVDLTVDGRAVPIVEEVAMLPLDLWAVEQGYNKIELNLVGL